MLQCIVVTPERTLYDQPAEFVALTLYDGEIGVAPGHAPLIGRLGFGEMRIRREEQTDRYYVEGGFVEVLDDVVSVLTQRAIPAAEIDAAVARERLSAAKDRAAATPEARAIRDRMIAQSRARLRVCEANSDATEGACTSEINSPRRHGGHRDLHNIMFVIRVLRGELCLVVAGVG